MSGLRSKINTALKGYWLIELLDYYDDIWKPKLKPGGFKNVVTTIAYVKAFRKANYPGGDVFLSQLSMEVATNFEHFVRNNPLKVYDRCEGNGLAKHVQRFKRIVNWAVEIKWITVNPFKAYSCPQKRTKRKKLSFQQLVAIEQQHFPQVLSAVLHTQPAGPDRFGKEQLLGQRHKR